MNKNELQKILGDKNYFTRNDLFKFYLRSEPNLNENTFSWRIFNLKRKGIIKEIGRGIYSMEEKSNYKIQLSKSAIKIGDFLSATFSELNYCISESSWVNEFSSHQYANSFIIAEVEKELIDSVFYSLKEKFRFVFIKPSEEDFERYIVDLDSPIILMSLISRAPLVQVKEKSHKYYTPTLEKLLVDIFVKSPQYYFLTESEIRTIFFNAFKKYNVNQTTLLAYAERRGKKNKLKTFIRDNGLDK